jgi:hypothetical protein
MDPRLARVLDRRLSALEILTVAIDAGLPTTDYQHSRFRNPASSIRIRACGFTKPDAESVVGPAEPLPQPVFPESKAETVGAVPGTGC